MTPPAAAAARTRTKRTSPPPRRVSGPTHRGPAARGPAAAGSRAAAVAAPPPLALRLGGAVRSVGTAEHHLLDRLVRGRAWIGILAVGLIGIVFMQVSMLRMNAGIGQAVERASTLERQNAAMRAAISELSSGERIATEAGKLGLILPAGTPRFLDARGADGHKAAASIRPPGEDIVPSTTSVEPTTAATAATPVLEPSSVAAGTPPATATPETAGAAPPATQSPPASEPSAVPPPAATAPPAATPPTTPTQSQTAAAPAAAPASTAATGGVDATGQAG